MPKVTYQYSFFEPDHPFELESGEVLVHPKIAYHTYGTLNEAKDNVVFICHALTANSDADDWWHGLFGEGDVFDWDENFIICANNLGSPYGTSSPKQINPETGERYGMDFPFYTIRDTANLHILLIEHFGINKIKLLIGGSCGGNISQEIAILLQERIENMVLLCCSAKEAPWVIAIHEAQRIALKSDKTLFENREDAGLKGLESCRAVALPFYRTSVSFNLRQKELDQQLLQNFRAASYITYQANKFVKRFDAHCYWTLLNGLDTHNVGRDREGLENALAQITAKTLVIAFNSDILIPKIEQQFLAKHIPDATYVCIKTLFGHDAFLIELEEIRRHIKNHIKI